MRKILLFITIFIGLLQSADLDELKDYLNKYRVIHLNLSYAPGLGHQMATIRVYEHLRDIGYLGKVEIIWDDERVEDSVARKLKKLFPKFKGRKALQHIKEENLSFISLSRFSRKIFAEPSLVISGGSDYQMFTGGSYRLSMQPSGWKRSSILFTPEGTHFFDDKYSNVGVELPAQEKVFEYMDLLDFPGDHIVHRNLKHIIETRMKVRSMPVYGPNYKNEGAQLSKVIEALEDVNNRIEKQKPMIVQLFYYLDDVNKKKMIKDHPNVKLLSINNALFIEDYKNLSPSDVVVIEIGPMAPKIFDFFFSKAKLPMIGAGKNAENLMRNIGRPYIMLTNKYDIVHNRNSFQKLFENIHLELDGKQAGVTALSSFIEDTINKRSDVYLSFRNASQRYRRKDKVNDALIKLMNLDKSRGTYQNTSPIKNCIKKIYNLIVTAI